MQRYIIHVCQPLPPKLDLRNPANMMALLLYPTDAVLLSGGVMRAMADINVYELPLGTEMQRRFFVEVDDAGHWETDLPDACVGKVDIVAFGRRFLSTFYPSQTKLATDGLVRMNCSYPDMIYELGDGSGWYAVHSPYQLTKPVDWSQDKELVKLYTINKYDEAAQG